jgi:EpsI family protein
MEIVVASIWKSKYLRVLSLILAAQAVLFYTVSHGDSRPLRQPLKAFPETLPGWQAVLDGVVDNDTRTVLRADDVLSRFYVRTPAPDFALMTPLDKTAFINSQSSELFVAYFSTQQQGQSPHSPKNCLPGAGWQPSVTGDLTLDIPGAAPITINQYVISRGEAVSVVLYWYQSHGRVVAHEFAAKFFLVADSMRYHRSDTALVRIVHPVIGGNVDAALKNATDLAKAAYPTILNYLPN